MNFSQLEENIRQIKKTNIECNLFNKNIDSPAKFGEFGIFVEKKDDFWEVYWSERGGAKLECRLYSESDLYDYIFCRYKIMSDGDRWF